MNQHTDSVWDLLVARIAALEAKVVRLNDDACERTKELEAKVAALGDEVQDLRELVEDEWIGGTDGE